MAEREATERTEGWLKALEPYRSDTRSRRHPLTCSDSALMVIDMQRYFLDDGSHAFLDGASRVASNVRRLVDLYRDRGLPVIFTRHALKDDEDPGIMATWWGDTLRDSDPMSEIVEDLRPIQGERVIRKTKYSAFIGTDLEKTLRSKGVERLLVTGVMTHLCVESTAREAFMRDFEVFVVVDGTSSGDDDLHLSSLRCLTDGFAVPVTTEEVIACARM
jgi:bifunctional isochorismate lyase/aryl carrier protein